MVRLEWRAVANGPAVNTICVLRPGAAFPQAITSAMSGFVVLLLHPDGHRQAIEILKGGGTPHLNFVQI